MPPNSPRSPLIPIVLVVFALGACSSDDGLVHAPDAGPGDVVETPEAGPSDDAARVDVTVNPQAPRAFRLAIGVPSIDLDSAFAAESWEFATANADILAIELAGGLPWPEILAEEALPPEYEAFLADLADRASQSERDVLLIVDPLNSDRNGLVGDVFGREDVDVSTLLFSNAELRRGYAAFCEDLAARFGPRYFVPVVEINRYGSTRSDDFDSLRSLYVDLREQVKFASANALVFPTWSYAQLVMTHTTQNSVQLAWFDRMDESLDLFAIDYRPSIDGRTASDLVPADLDIIDRHRDETAGGSYTTRPVAVVFGGYPGEGVVQGGEVFASSENSQFNYLAFLLGEGDRIDMELVTWTVPVDPDEWLAESCAGDAGCNGAVREARYGGFRRHGLVGPSGDRAARRLWSQYFERMFVR